MRSLLSLLDLQRKELEAILNKTSELKRGFEEKPLEGEVVILYFERPSTRTRVSFEVAAKLLGAEVVVVDREQTQLTRGESVEDVARTFGSYSSCIVARVERHSTLERFKEASGVPVINALSDIEHPCQAISDLFTIMEVRGLEGVKVAWVGDGTNVCNSLLLGCAMLGIKLSVATPPGYEPSSLHLKNAAQLAALSGAKVELLHDPKAAVRGADFIYTDVWVSMGKEHEAEERLRAFRGFQVNRELLRLAKPTCKVMHCLPAHRGREISADVLESEASIVWQQAANKLPAQEAVLLWTFGLS